MFYNRCTPIEMDQSSLSLLMLNFNAKTEQKMRIVSFNTNGIRARPHQLEALRDKYDPDVIGIQETKAQDADFPLPMIEDLGYHAEFFGQKSHYGVALLSKTKPLSVNKGYPGDAEDAQRRMITATYEIDGENFIKRDKMLV